METERDAANFVRVSAGWGYHAHIPNENKNWNIKTSIALLFLLISLRRKTVFDERFFISWFVMVEKGCFIMSDLRLTMGHDCMYSIVVVILVALLALDERIAHAHRTFTATKNMHIFFLLYVALCHLSVFSIQVPSFIANHSSSYRIKINRNKIPAFEYRCNVSRLTNEWQMRAATSNATKLLVCANSTLDWAVAMMTSIWSSVLVSKPDD